MYRAVESPYLVPFNGSFSVAKAPTKPGDEALERKTAKKKLRKLIKEFYSLQRILYASNSYSLLLVFQAMDAAGKDSTIRAVMTGVNPAGCQVFSFKQPSSRELDHDFLWRTNTSMPERGRIGIFNRSYYEEVLVVRVHPEYLQHQRLPDIPPEPKFWEDRFESIADMEKHLARNGTVILKFWLNVSKEEQTNRLLSRIDEKHKNWKFSPSDLKERALWPSYMKAYQDTLNATSKLWAPWYAIPADDKPFMRLQVADIIVRSLASLKLSYPKVSEQQRQRLLEMKEALLSQAGKHVKGQ